MIYKDYLKNKDILKDTYEEYKNESELNKKLAIDIKRGTDPEALMKKLPCIKECVVYADEENTGIYALIYPDSDICARSGAETAGEIKEYIRPQLDAFNSEMPAYKRITDFFITDKEFEKSTTHKIQRFKIAAVNK